MEDQDKVHCYSLGLNYFRQKQNPDMENKEQMVQVCQIGRSKNEKVEKNALHQVTAIVNAKVLDTTLKKLN